MMGAVHLAQLRLRDFRNYARLDLAFQPGFHLLLGENAQGKTNLLEAIYLMATLRSFRGVGGAQLIRQGQRGYFVGGRVFSGVEHEIRMYWSPRERKLLLDQQPVRKLSDYLGILRAVVFCSEDLQLVKGSGKSRRRYLDYLLAHSHPGYVPLLQRYTRALRSRNALLRRPFRDEAAIESFSRELVQSGGAIIRLRSELVPGIAPLVSAAYRRVAPQEEEIRVEYRTSVAGDFALALKQSQERERSTRTTVVGPHRDDLALLIQGRSAAQFASEGQKRSLAIALKMAQAEHLTTLHGAPPILLIDDVMGELDRQRRSGFLPLLQRSQERQGQVFMTCTEENWPAGLAGTLHRWSVRGGRVDPIGLAR